jgi:rod shape-determining protein MreC
VRENSGRDFVVLLALCVLGAVLGRMQTNARSRGEFDRITGFVRATVNPPAEGIVRLSNSSSGFFGGLFNAAELTAENRHLKQLEIIAKSYGETIDRLNSEVDNLRNLLELPPVAGRTKVSALVMGFFPTENRITISVGRARGIKQGLAVVTGDGLVGIVQSVGEAESQVSLISDPNRKIGALVINRNPPPAGLITGENASTLVLTLDATMPVENGDSVATWGYSGLMPRGIPIGRVNQIYVDQTTGSKRVEVFPNVSLGSIREVVVLK